MRHMLSEFVMLNCLFISFSYFGIASHNCLHLIPHTRPISQRIMPEINIHKNFRLISLLNSSINISVSYTHLTLPTILRV